MRKDIGKIITERERTGSSLPSPKTGLSIRWNGYEGEYDYDRKASMSWNRLVDRKGFTDVLSPLYRWLDKQVGRPWNKVYSEICANLDKRKVTHVHVLDHLFQRIERNVFMGVDGQYHARSSGFFSVNVVDGLYVHPRNGLILRQKPKPKIEKPEDVEEVKLTELTAWKKIKGIWYFCEYRKPTAVEVTIYRSSKMIVVRKKQLGKKELRDLRKRIDA